jgi:hypothetical protein
LNIDMEGLAPIPKPPWVDAACKPGSDEAVQLVGKSILYKWPARVGGWALGKVQDVNKDTSREVNRVMCNCKVYYSMDGCVAEHCLTTRKYARNSSASNDSWVLLGEK